MTVVPGARPTATSTALPRILADGGGAFNRVSDIEAEAQGHSGTIVRERFLVFRGVHKGRRFTSRTTLNAAADLRGSRGHQALMERGVDLLLELTLTLGLRRAHARCPALIREGLVSVELPGGGVARCSNNKGRPPLPQFQGGLDAEGLGDVMEAAFPRS